MKLPNGLWHRRRRPLELVNWRVLAGSRELVCRLRHAQRPHHPYPQGRCRRCVLRRPPGPDGRHWNSKNTYSCRSPSRGYRRLASTPTRSSPAATCQRGSRSHRRCSRAGGPGASSRPRFSLVKANTRCANSAARGCGFHDAVLSATVTVRAGRFDATAVMFQVELYEQLDIGDIAFSETHWSNIAYERVREVPGRKLARTLRPGGLGRGGHAFIADEEDQRDAMNSSEGWRKATALGGNGGCVEVAHRQTACKTQQFVASEQMRHEPSARRLPPVTNWGSSPRRRSFGSVSLTPCQIGR